jgi:hypothetical protein
MVARRSDKVREKEMPWESREKVGSVVWAKPTGASYNRTRTLLEVGREKGVLWGRWSKTRTSGWKELLGREVG